MGYHSIRPPQPNRFCDAIECINPCLTNGRVIPCGYAYHDECWIKINFLCVYCHNYLSDSIDELAKSYNKRLEMTNDIQNEFEIQRDELTQEEDREDTDDVPVYEYLNQKFHELLTGILNFHIRIIIMKLLY